MEIKSRTFPYPVLAPNSDDFTNGDVQLANVKVVAAPERYIIMFHFMVSHAHLASLVTNGDASAAVVIECRHNLYRKRHNVKLGQNTVKISADEICGVVHITPLISSARLLMNYFPEGLNPDYNDLPFPINVPKHGILAYGSNIVFPAEPQADRLRRISSIMRIIPSDRSHHNMTVNIDGPRIRVEVSPDQFRLYQMVAASRRGSSILASMLVLPVLVDVLHQIRANQQDAWEDYRWFRVIRSRLQSIGQSVDSPAFDPMKAAQSILDSPFARGLDELVQRLDLNEND